MNTKSLLLAAVVAAVGAVSGSAQVTSQNIVGYVRLSLAKGYNLIGNQLNNGNNAIGTVLNVPDGTAVYKFTGGKFQAFVQRPVSAQVLLVKYTLEIGLFRQPFARSIG
jgi:opacity protein-like surface antigen